ncbi:MAG: alanine racemase [Actinomycetes bacterium]
MPFILHIDTPRWRDHLERYASATEGLVPVVKGNGYGFTNARLAAESARLGATTMAVGTPQEAAELAAWAPSDLLVLTPLPEPDAAIEDPRVIATVAHLDVARGLARRSTAHHRPRVVVELRTAIRRHGLAPADLTGLTGVAGGLALEGFAVHLPVDRPDRYDPVAEVLAWLGRLDEHGLASDTLWVSHLSAAERDAVRATRPGLRLRPRVGTQLWLGDSGATRAAGSVLDVHRVARGERVGYHQGRTRRAGWVVVVAGGTAHGVGLEAPRAVRGGPARLRELARGVLDASGLALSPFSWAGRKRWFAEPPHMQVSLLLLPGSVAPPARGVELACQVRMTTVRFDQTCDQLG